MELERVEILDRIDRLTGDPSADPAQELRELKGEYNRIVTNSYNNPTTGCCDILDVFPPEVWIQIIKDSLPASGYAPALLLFTMVSCKWMNTLVSIPTLWSHVEIRGSADDSLATIETFTHLSRGVPILLSIYAPPRHDVGLMDDILASIGPRLREVIIRHDTREMYASPVEILSALKHLLRIREHLSNVVWIRLEHELAGPIYGSDIADMLRGAPLPPSLCAIYGWSFHWRDMQVTRPHTVQLKEIEAFRPIEDVITSRIDFSGIRRLSISKFRGHTPNRGEHIIQEGFPSLPDLTRISYRNAYRTSMINLLQSIASQLLELELRIPISKVDVIRPVLVAATRLEVLCLRVNEWNNGSDEGGNAYDTTDGDYPGPTSSIPHLRHLKVKISFSNAVTSRRTAQMKLLNDQIVQRLLSALSVLYRNVTRMELDLFHSEILLPITLRYISELPRLKILLFESTKQSHGNQFPLVHMPPLEELNTGRTPLLLNLRCPSVDSLTLTWGSYCADSGILDGIDVRKLWITTDNWNGTIEFSQNCFPNLTQLTFFFERQYLLDSRPRFTLKSFPLLSTITILTDTYTNHATRLCFTLLYHPDTCPSLQEIRFPRYPPDWDVLFTMLEKRNFMAYKSVSRIRRITLPFIAYRLRAPLSNLLRGLFAERPSNENLLLGGNYEYLLDERVPGCFLCLANFLDPCNRPVQADTAAVKHAYSGYASDTELIREATRWTTPPIDVDEAILEWVMRRQVVSQDFLSNLEIWGRIHQRVLSCKTRLLDRARSTVVEITEHDI